MEVPAAKSLPLAIAAMSVLFLLTPRVCRATSVESGNETKPSLFSAGHPENGLVADADWESEFMMDSEISRMLSDVGTFSADHALDRGKSVVNCGRGKQYYSCAPLKNKVPIGEHCVTYQRGCGFSSS